MAILQNALTTEVVVSSNSYIFDGAGGMRDQLEQTIMQELEAKEYPLKVAIENVKSGGFWGTKEQCVTIEVSPKSSRRVVIANTTVGSYLYVNIYHLRRVLNTKDQVGLPEVITDIFAHQRTQAAYAAAVAATESAFAKLELKQINSGYRPLLNGAKNEG